MKKEALTLSYQLENGKFKPHKGTEVGKVLEDGSIEGTDYKFEPGKINGGIAVTKNSRLKIEEDGSLHNPATGDTFEETKNGKGYWSPVSKTYVKKWLEVKK